MKLIGVETDGSVILTDPIPGPEGPQGPQGPPGTGGGGGVVALWAADGPQIVSPSGSITLNTDWTAVVLRTVAPGDRFEFDYRVMYQAGLGTAIKMGLWFPPGTEFTYYTPSNVKASPNATAVRNVAVDDTHTGYFEFSGNGGDWPMLGHLQGVVTTVTTAGDVELRYGVYLNGYPSEHVRLLKRTLLKEWPLP